QIEELGSEGKVEEAQGMMKLVEQLKEERELLRSTTSTIESFAAQEKQMEVCEVCGAFLIVGDAQSRVDDHLMGKQHMGYAKIKATVEELKEKLRKRTEEPDRDERLKKEKQEREEREKERDWEREERERGKDEEKRKKEKKKELETEKEERGVDQEVGIQAELLTEDAAGLGTTKDHEVEREGQAEVEINEEAEAMIDQKESIDLVVGIEEDQKAEIESHISTGAKVETENKIENQRRKKRGDLMIKKVV
ncbi:unnamed protein product, partial [Rangifer tarandus platyrhynchus]